METRAARGVSYGHPGFGADEIEIYAVGALFKREFPGRALLGAKWPFGDALIYGQRALGAKTAARLTRNLRGQRGGWYFITTSRRHSLHFRVRFCMDFRKFRFKFKASGTPCFAAERPRKEIWADHPCCTAVFALRNHSSGGAASWGGNLVSTGKPPHGSRNQMLRMLPPETFLVSASCLLTFCWLTCFLFLAAGRCCKS